MLRKLLGLLHDALVYGISGFLSQLIGFLLLPLYTKFLTPEDYGVMAMLSIAAAVFEPLARCGMTQAVFRFYNLAKDDQERANALSTGLASVLVSTVLLLVVGLTFAAPLATFIAGGSNSAMLLRLVLLSSAISVASSIPTAALRADRRVKAMSVFNLLKLVASLTITIWLVVGLQQGIAGVIWGTLIAEALSCLGLFALTYRSFPLRFCRDLWRAMMEYGIPFLPHHLQAVGLELFGVYVIRQVLGVDEAGLYNIATKFALPLTFCVNSVQQAWVAYKFHRLKNDENPALFFRTVVTYYLTAIAYLWLGVSLWGPELLKAMTAAQFHAAAGLISLVALISLARGVFSMLGTGLEFAKSVKHAPLVSLAGLVTVVGTTYPLVDRFGAQGAALATVLGWIAMTAVIYYLSQRLHYIKYDWSTIVRIAAMLLIVTLAGIGVPDWPTWPRILSKVGLSLAFPPLALWILWNSKYERERMEILFSKLTRRPRGNPDGFSTDTVNVAEKG